MAVLRLEYGISSIFLSIEVYSASFHTFSSSREVPRGLDSSRENARRQGK